MMHTISKKGAEQTELKYHVPSLIEMVERTHEDLLIRFHFTIYLTAQNAIFKGSYIDCDAKKLFVNKRYRI